MLTLMLLGALVALALAAAAWLLERGLRAASIPTRGVWLAAMLGALALTATAPLRRGAPLVLTATATGELAPKVAGERATPILIGRLRDAARTPLRIAAAADGTVPDGILAGAWILLSAGLGLIAMTTLRRARLARAAWPVREVAGVPVRVSAGTGPAVLGVRRPEVVVPAWLLESDPEEQRLVVLHEAEHVRAGDPALMAAGVAIALLLPWNPAVWWMLLRLRLALEMDCDRRVLRGGVRPGSYGALLLRVAARAPALNLAAPAMAGTGANLERRLRAMTNPNPRFGALRATMLTIVAAAVAVAACETRLPTTAEVEAMDARAAERQASPMMTSGAAFVIDGRPATAAEAHALTPEQIVQIEVLKNESGTGEIRITTGSAASGQPRRVSGTAIETPAGESRERTDISRFEGLILIDGVVSTPARAHALDPNRIASVEVVKGAAAGDQHDDPRARHGIIRITTRQPR